MNGVGLPRRRKIGRAYQRLARALARGALVCPAGLRWWTRWERGSSDVVWFSEPRARWLWSARCVPFTARFDRADNRRCGVDFYLRGSDVTSKGRIAK